MGVLVKEVSLVEKKVVGEEVVAFEDVDGLREVVAGVAQVKVEKLGFLACEDKQCQPGGVYRRG